MICCVEPRPQLTAVLGDVTVMLPPLLAIENAALEASSPVCPAVSRAETLIKADDAAGPGADQTH